MKELTIGRNPDNNIVIDNAMVGRYHAKIVMDKGGRYEVVDLQSKNGTFVNGRKVKGTAPVSPGQRVVVANVTVTADWKSMFDSIPDDEPPSQVIVNAPVEQPRKTVIPNSVLYDFSKDVPALFEAQDAKLKQIITDFRTTRLPQRRHSVIKRFSEDVLDLLIERYDFIGSQISTLLKKLQHESEAFQILYNEDMKKLDITYQYRLSNSSGEADLAAGLNQVDVRKNEMKQHFEQMCTMVLPMLKALISEYYTKNPPFFIDRLELAPATSQLWNNIPNQNSEIQKTFYIGEKEENYVILQEPVTLKKRVYVQSLYGGNMLFKYTAKQKQQCYNTVNALISRMLAMTSNAKNGNLNVVMVDMGDMEGTSSFFKGLNKSVFKVISRYDEFTAMLNAEASRAENIILNLLQGDISNISEYNQSKSEKVPYTLLVLKDIPTGYGNDIGPRMAKIFRSGPRAGLSVMALVDVDEANRTEESTKAFRALQSAIYSAPCETVDFTTDTTISGSSQIAHYESFPGNIISAIVRKVNQGLEVKTESILRFSEYMLPHNDWWSGQSANRIDLPFGRSKDMKTTALQITQESGQNTAVVIGIPGSGKSVFLHTIIASAITHYSPAELQIYLLDFSGVEFNVYAKHKLPHARVIAPEAEREFGLSILREVFEEGTRRMALCRDNGVTNIVELKRVNPDVIVPRLLVIIDEFQKIFEIENDNISKEANAKIHAIIQEYRKFGINLILATQKLPSKSVVPYDLIANRVLFKSDPGDFNNLVHWPHSEPLPRLQTGMCIYNNESGAEMANQVSRSYFINASKELETILDELYEFSTLHPEKMDDHVLRIFRSDELPKFTERLVAERHYEPQPAPREVGVYLGESIAIAQTHVFVPLTKDSNNNILIIGGDQSVAKGIAYHAMLSEIAAHTEMACNVILMNFMMDDDPMQSVFQSELFAAASGICNLRQAITADEVKGYLQFIKDEVIDARKSDPSMPMTHFFINIFEFQRGRMFDGTGSRGDMQSECARLLEYILKNGPMVGVFTLLQIDNMVNLNKVAYNAQNMFCHRVALQMPEQESDKIVGNSAANKLLVLNRPATKFRALYYNNVNNATAKFKPYCIN